MEYCNTLRGKLIILGDFNIHFDSPSNPLTSKALQIITTFDIVQDVRNPTHRCGHIIDWVLYRESEQLVRSCLVAHALSSDHLPVVCRLNIANPQRQLIFRELRNIKAINRNALKRDVAAMVHTQPELTARQLNDELRSLLDKHAPATRRRVPAGRSSPWYAGVSQELRSAKRQRRRAERRWLKTGLTVDKQIYGDAKRAVTNIVHKAKSDYFSSQIAQSNCCKELFSVCNELRGCNSGLSLPTALPVCDLPDAFADYFIRKVKTIRDELDSQMPVPIPPTDGPYTQSSLHFFEPVSMQCVKNTILQPSQKTCSLDPLPTSSLLNAWSSCFLQ